MVLESTGVMSFTDGRSKVLLVWSFNERRELSEYVTSSNTATKNTEARIRIEVNLDLISIAITSLYQLLRRKVLIII